MTDHVGDCEESETNWVWYCSCPGDRRQVLAGLNKTSHEFFTPDEPCQERVLVEALRKLGYLVIPPGDASPVGELVRAACAYDGFPLARVGVFTVEAEQLLRAAVDVPEDPAVRAWVERGRR